MMLLNLKTTTNLAIAAFLITLTHSVTAVGCTETERDRYKALGLGGTEIDKLCAPVGDVSASTGEAICITKYGRCFAGQTTSLQGPSSCYCNYPPGPVIGTIQTPLVIPPP